MYDFVNQVTFIGNVGREAELQTSTNDKLHSRFSLAVDTFSGKEKEAMWLSISAWGSLAEQVSKVVKKGSLVLVNGRLSVRTYTDKEQTQRTAVEVIANTVQVLAQAEAKAKSQDTADAEEEALSA